MNWFKKLFGRRKDDAVTTAPDETAEAPQPPAATETDVVVEVVSTAATTAEPDAATEAPAEAESSAELTTAEQDASEQTQAFEANVVVAPDDEAAADFEVVTVVETITIDPVAVAPAVAEVETPADEAPADEALAEDAPAVAEPVAAEPADPAIVRGARFTTWSDTIRDLKRDGKVDEALALALECVDAAEAVSGDAAPTPSFTTTAAIIHRQAKDYAAEVAILERYLAACPAGAPNAKITERLDRARTLNAQPVA